LALSGVILLRTDDVADLPRESLECDQHFIAIAMSIIDAPHAGNLVTKRPLRRIGCDAGAAH
jgi:hypothetical protein